MIEIVNDKRPSWIYCTSEKATEGQNLCIAAINQLSADPQSSGGDLASPSRSSALSVTAGGDPREPISSPWGHLSIYWALSCLDLSVSCLGSYGEVGECFMRSLFIFVDVLGLPACCFLLPSPARNGKRLGS